MTTRRKVIVHIATSADGYIARPDGDLDWLTSRPAPKGFYGMNAFMKSIDTTLLGRKTYEVSLRMGAKFGSKGRTIVFSRHAPPADAPPGVEFVNGDIGPFVSRLREQPGKDLWLMGGGDLIASFLDEQAIDEFVISVVPVLIGDGIPLIARRHRHVPLDLRSVERFEDGLVQLHYRVQKEKMPMSTVSVRYMIDDVPEAMRFYTTLLGFELEKDASPAFASVVKDGVRLLLSGEGSSGKRALPDGRRQVPGGWNRVHLEVTDLAAEVARLRAAGVSFRMDDIVTGPGGAQIILDDPSGNPVELFQPRR